MFGVAMFVLFRFPQLVFHCDCTFYGTKKLRNHSMYFVQVNLLYGICVVDPTM